MSTEQTTETDSFDMDLTVTATSGIQIPMKLVLTYPEGHGYYAAEALQAIPDNMDGIWQELINRQDASIIKVMMDSGHYSEDED